MVTMLLVNEIKFIKTFSAILDIWALDNTIFVFVDIRNYNIILLYEYSIILKLINDSNLHP